jgi:hypothetical protein
MAQNIDFILARKSGFDGTTRLKNLQTRKSGFDVRTKLKNSQRDTILINTGKNQFLNNLFGPSNEDGSQKLIITAGTSNDKIYYNNWDGITLGFTSTLIFVNGVQRASISHTTDRVGTQFGYSISSATPQSYTTPQAYGVFTNLGNVYLTI